jgi:sulfotransferase
LIGLHFIAGLPRSGSTMLSAILRQNPTFHTGISSPLAFLFDRILPAMGAHSEFETAFDNLRRRNVLLGLAEAFYWDRPDKVVFDTNRAWCAHVELIADLFPDARIICCVREYVWVINSFERLLNRNPYLLSKMFKPDEGNTVFRRVENLASPTGTAGFAWHAFQQAYYGPHRDRLIVIDYDDFVREPGRVMSKLYGELDYPYFAHDFDNFSNEGGEFDQRLGLPGLHDVKGPVRVIKEQCVLPPELFDRFKGRTFWRRDTV